MAKLSKKLTFLSTFLFSSGEEGALLPQKLRAKRSQARRVTVANVVKLK